MHLKQKYHTDRFLERVLFLFDEVGNLKQRENSAFLYST